MKKCLRLIVFGILSFASCKKNSGPPAPQIINISPDKGAAYMHVTITGLHFDSVASNITVKFNGVAATVSSSTDTSVVAIVPVNATTGKVTVTVNGIAVTSSVDFVILPGTWIQKANMPDPNPPNGRGLGIGFAIGNYGYMGFGTNNGNDYDDLFRYDPSADSWTQMASMGTEIEDLVSMVINNKAYAGIGYSRQLNDFTTMFSEYDPSANTWTAKASFPGVKRQDAFGFSVGNSGYVCFGYNPEQANTDVWQYNPSADTWTQKNNFPGAGFPQWPIGFVIDSLAYVGSSEGFNSDGAAPWWQYNPSTDTWTQKNNFPGQPTILASSMVINGKGYIMGGGYENWQYDPSSDTWTQQAFFSERVGSSSFVIGNSGYLGLGSSYAGFLQTDLWKFTPSQ